MKGNDIKEGIMKKRFMTLVLVLTLFLLSTSGYVLSEEMAKEGLD